MKLYLRTLGRFWGASMAAKLEYPLNFLVELIAVAGNLAGSLFVLSLFYKPGRSLGGWSWEAALVVLGIYTLLDGVTSTLLQPNLSTIVKHVQNGTLDFVLLKPVDSQFWLSFRIFSPWGLPGFATGLGLIFYGVNQAAASPQVGVAAVLLLGASITTLYSLWFMLAATSIWFVKVWNATDVLRSTLEAGRYPVSAYPTGLRFFFTFLLPVAFLTTVPAEAFLGHSSNEWLMASMSVTALALTASRLFWRYALRFYTSASS